MMEPPHIAVNLPSCLTEDGEGQRFCTFVCTMLCS
uniref:Uncharacterized protein n=1 Tax=Nelumbo nucifera TaxID=4432 RepID=A0A822Z5L8_NELNU|nr:TPA_asm: hypothetical protein HUJ06_014695 [Nelumbo nucifera]